MSRFIFNYLESQPQGYDSVTLKFSDGKLLVESILLRIHSNIYRQCSGMCILLPDFKTKIGLKFRQLLYSGSTVLRREEYLSLRSLLEVLSVRSTSGLSVERKKRALNTKRSRLERDNGKTFLQSDKNLFTQKQYVTIKHSNVEQVTHEPSDVQQVTIQYSVEEHVAHEHSEERHVILDSSDVQQVTLDSSNVQKITIKPSVEEHVTPEPSEEQHVILDHSDKQQVTTDPLNVKQVTLKPSNGQHVKLANSDRHQFIVKPLEEQVMIKIPKERHINLKKLKAQHVTLKLPWGHDESQNNVVEEEKYSNPDNLNTVQLVDMVDPTKNTMEGLDFKEINDMEQIIEDLAEDSLEHLDNNDQSCAELFQDQTMLINSINQSIELQSNSELLNQSNLILVDQYNQPSISQSDELIKSTPPKQIKKAPVFRCNFDSCNLTFKSLLQLGAHTTSSHGVQPLLCPENKTGCSFRASTKQKIDFHLRGVHRDKYSENIFCTLCEKLFSSRQHLTSHIKRVHRKVEGRVCPFCGILKKNLSDHFIREHRSSQFKCEQCPKSFKTRSQLRIHVNVHTGFKPYTCGSCSAVFSRNHHRKYHLEQTNHIPGIILKGSSTVDFRRGPRTTRSTRNLLDPTFGIDGSM